MRRLAASLLLSLALATPAGAAPMTPRQQALILLRALVYDRNLRARAGSEVAVAVVFRPGHAASEAERTALVEVLDEVSQQAVAAGLPVRVFTVAWRDREDLAARLADRPAAALFACSGLEEQAAALAEVARRRGVLAASGSRVPLEQGFALALVERGSRAGLVVSPAAAAAQGADLDSALLQLAEIFERPGPARP